MTKISRYVSSLRDQAAQARKQVALLLSHPGEKGRAVEHIVRGIVRTILPKRFSIGSGFAVTAQDNDSAQLDIVIFDEQLNAPLSLVGDIGVFPIECIYATIEVKSWLDAEKLEGAAASIGKMRTFRPKKYIQEFILEERANGEVFLRRPDLDDPKDDLVIEKPSPRSYLFAFDTKWSLETLKDHLHTAAQKHGAFFHGVIVLERGWYIVQMATDVGAPLEFQMYDLASQEGEALKKFVMKLSKDVITFPMYAANMRRYLGSPEDGAA